jgi:hypothetical protein
MDTKINELILEGGKIVQRTDEFCIVEKNGQFYCVDKNGNITPQHIICD